MTNELILTLLSFLLGGVIGGFIQTLYNYKKEVLSSIWTKRLEEYKVIWEISGILPKFPEDRDVTYNDLYDTCIKLKNWYFKNGGILLSTKSRKVYETLQKIVLSTSQKRKDQKLSIPDYKTVRETFSLFRSELTKDLTSRNKSLF